MERRRARGRRRAGFTLAEVLVTLGIVAVLLALAVPSVAVVRKNLKMAELNATAREIFVAAQNNLTGLAAGGGKVELSAKAAEEDPDKMVCVMSGEAVMDSVLPLGAVDPTAAGNHYMVVYYPATLTVAEVYYSERAFDKGGEPLRGEYGGADKADARRKDEVGFYNGENATASPAKSLPKPILTVTNGEELVVEVDVSGLPSEVWGKASLVVSLSDGIRTVEVRDKTLTAKDTVEEVVLDRLVSGQHFCELYKDLTAGADITITAIVEYIGSDKSAWSPSAPVQKTTNSLFDSREADGTVKISCGRHLQNLDTYTSGMKPTGFFNAVQTDDIDWSKNGKKEFAAIGNEFLVGYDGQNNEIMNLAVRPNDEVKVKGVGLFGVTSSMEMVKLSNIRIINSNVEGRNGLPSGCLVGIVNFGGVDVSNCLVYWDGTGGETARKTCYVSGNNSSVGGLIGRAAETSTTISYCGVGLPLINGSWCYGLGGLVGFAENITITNSYSAVDQLSGSAEQIGGFVGRGENVNIANCYAVGNVSADRRSDKPGAIISGFVSGNGTVEHSYCAMTYFDEAGATQDREISYGFMSAMEHPTCAYLKPNAPVTILNSEDEKTKELTYEELKSWGAGKSAWTTLSELDSHPYRDMDKGEPKAYPFPGLLTESGSPLPHYGSWPKEPEVPAAGGGLTYYESYADGTWGYYTVDLETGAVSNTLQGNEFAILETGYGVLLPKGTTPKALGPVKVVDIYDFNGEMFVETPLQNAVTADGSLLYPLAHGIMTPIDKVIGWFRSGATVTVGDKGTFIINPHFGAAILKSDNTTDLGKEQSPLQIRTVAQFNSLGTIKTLPNYLYFSQTHDIDFEFNGTTSGLALNMSVIYDGRGNRLLQRSDSVFQDTNSASIIKNVVVERAKITGANNTGILLGTNSGGTVSGCTIIDSTIEGTNVAGLLWQNNSTVENCSFRASTSYGDAKVVSENGQAAGLIGRNGGSVSECFAAGTVTGKEASGFAIQAGNVKESYSNCIVTGKSGAAGFHYTEYALATDCYSVSTVRVSESGDAAGFSLSRNWPGLTRCYFAGTVETKNGKSYGFAPNTTNGSDRYYYTPSIVEQGTNGVAGKALDYQELLDFSFRNDGQAWTNGTPETTHPYALATGERYPFPRLAALDHWGDWPQEPAGFPVEENILGVFYYTVTALDNGRYRFSVHTSALKCDSDGKEMPEGKNPFAEVMTVDVALDAPPTNKFGMGVFWSDGFNFDVAHGKDKGYYYEGDGNKVRLDSDSIQQSAVFYPGYHFVTVEPDEDDGEYEIELKFKHNGSSGTNGHDWDCEFQYSNEKGFELDLDQD